MTNAEAAMINALKLEALAEERVHDAKRQLSKAEFHLTQARNSVEAHKHWLKQSAIRDAEGMSK